MVGRGRGREAASGRKAGGRKRDREKKVDTPLKIRLSKKDAGGPDWSMGSCPAGALLASSKEAGGWWLGGRGKGGLVKHKGLLKSASAVHMHAHSVLHVMLTWHLPMAPLLLLALLREVPGLQHNEGL